MMPTDLIKKEIQKALDSLSFKSEGIQLEHPVSTSYGDYSSNIAMMLAKTSKQSPKELAENIAEKIRENKPQEIEKIEIAGSGFINFFLSHEFFADSIAEILSAKEKWGSNESLSGKKIMVEYTDPNPFKEFHIGHLMSNAIGESLSRLIEFSGAEVKRANYQSDVGLHVAKAIWGRMQKPNSSWGEAYTIGTQEYKTNKNAIDTLNKSIYEKSDEKINMLYEEGRKATLEEFEKIYKKLNTKFDYYFFESEVWSFGKKIVEKNVGNIFEESDGAIVFRGEKYGLHTRVFLTSEGLPTYEAKELGLVKIKYDKYKYDESIVVTGNEIREYFKVLLSAIKLIYPELAEKTIHISHGMLRLPSGKMSSRTGDVITAESLIGQITKSVLEKMKDTDVQDKEIVAEQIAIGALKYSILKQSAGKDIIFDLNKALSFEGDSGPYLQYAHTRAQAVLSKADEQEIKKSTKKRSNVVSELEKLLYRFPETIERAQKHREPHYITTYLIELAGAFNSFYAQERIVDAKEHAEYKVALTRAFQITIQNGLWILGIKTPEKM